MYADLPLLNVYRVIRKSLRDFRPLWYSSRDGHAEGERVNRGRDTPSFCPTLQVLDICTLGDAADVNPVIKFLRHALQNLAVDSSDCLHDRHDYPLVVEPATMPRPLVQKKNYERFSTY